jgi:peptide/nickel transport system permease protein
MTAVRTAAASVLAIVFAVCLGADILCRHGYADQDREHPNEAPSRQYPLGTDELGRDRFSRLVYGGRVSLLVAPAAAAISTALAATIGAAAALLGRRWYRTTSAAMDLFMAMPTILILLTVRTLLPLNTSPWLSIVITCGLLGCLGWAQSARVFRERAASLLASDFMLQARASGSSSFRIFVVQMIPNLRPAIAAQFWIGTPLFVLAEANLSLLGLGVSEPAPSWGNMLRELENYAAVPERPWVLAPAFALLIVVCCLHLLLPARSQTRSAPRPKRVVCQPLH